MRLAACEGLDSITIGGTRWGEVHIERAAVVLRASTGDAAPRLHFRPAPAEVLTLAGRPWPGTLTVELRPQGGLSITNLVPMEEYVSGVLAKELILWSAEPAELEAQAIAARTYALSMLARRRPASTDPGAAFLWSDTRDQAYDGIFVPEDSPAARRVARRLEEAVARTAGLVLTSGSSLLDARFHAACGGRTAALHEQFPTSPGPPIEAVHCPPCDRRALDEARPTAAPVPTARPVTWSTTIPAADLAQLAKDLEIGQRLLSLRPLETGATHRWLTVELTGTRGRTTIPLEEFRRRLGQRAVASAHITSTWPHCGNPLKSGLFLRGRGRGHGVGLCQTGAHDRAVQGWSHSRILSHYYPRARITPLPRHKQTGGANQPNTPPHT
ncbi:MAG: SpoIID/LytB domain-containing protein [Planctomycetota bacterium]|nr:SpoIID/LytB domain-containing protein [Planctomycetota bacterium]